MAAHESLSSDQFEEIAKNRMLRIGNRRYPAAFTKAYPEGGGGAIIPMESGSIARVEYRPHPYPRPNNEPYAAGWRTRAFDAPEHFTQDVGQVHERLDELSRSELSPERMAANKEWLTWMVRHKEQGR
jgi:hypothetical protein